MELGPIAITLLGLGGLLGFVGFFVLLIGAFRVNAGWGLAVLFLPFAALVFVFAHWRKARTGFLIQLVAALVIAGAMIPVYSSLAEIQGAVATEEGLPAGEEKKLSNPLLAALSSAQNIVPKRTPAPVNGPDLASEIGMPPPVTDGSISNLDIMQMFEMNRLRFVELEEWYTRLERVRKELPEGDGEALKGFNEEVARYNAAKEQAMKQHEALRRQLR